MFPRAVLFIGIAAVTLTSCAPNTLRAKVGGQDIIRDFKMTPARAQLRLNESIEFSFNLNKPGFVTVFTTDSDRRTYELDRNINVAGGPFKLPLDKDPAGGGLKALYKIVEPLGKQLVYLAFTEKPIPAEIKLKGILDEAALEKRIREALEKSGGAKDIVSLEFEVIK